MRAWVFNRVLCPSYQGFRIYRETLSRFSCAASAMTSRKTIGLLCILTGIILLRLF
ncbi:hypothetical protein ACT6QE_07125 [Staphylococcus aureus]